eukprot:scaffold1206_cov388-Prasinococcus_capsulatus_cf.AAC.21
MARAHPPRRLRQWAPPPDCVVAYPRPLDRVVAAKPPPSPFFCEGDPTTLVGEGGNGWLRGDPWRCRTASYIWRCAAPVQVRHPPALASGTEAARPKPGPPDMSRCAAIGHISAAMFGIDSAAVRPSEELGFMLFSEPVPALVLWQGLIVAVISVFEAIQQKTELIQCNKHRCKRLIRRVSLFHGYLERQRKSKLSKGEAQYTTTGAVSDPLNARLPCDPFDDRRRERRAAISVESIARSVSQGTIPTVWWTEDEEDEGKDIEEGLDEIKKEKSVLMKNFGMEEAQVDQAIEQMQRLKGPSSGKSTAHDVSTETLRIIADEELKFAKGTIGVGGSAQVSKAVWKCKENGVLVERTVAVKRIVLGTATRRVSREIRIHQSLQHENIVKLYGQLKCNLGSTTGLVLEFMEGGSLYDYLRAVRDPAQEEESPTELQGWKIFLDILQGLQFLHGRQVVHADMKSSNVRFALVVTHCFLQPLMSSWCSGVVD